MEIGEVQFKDKPKIDAYIFARGGDRIGLKARANLPATKNGGV